MKRLIIKFTSSIVEKYSFTRQQLQEVYLSSLCAVTKCSVTCHKTILTLSTHFIHSVSVFGRIATWRAYGIWLFKKTRGNIKIGRRKKMGRRAGRVLNKEHTWLRAACRCWCV